MTDKFDESYRPKNPIYPGPRLPSPGNQDNEQFEGDQEDRVSRYQRERDEALVAFGEAGADVGQLEFQLDEAVERESKAEDERDEARPKAAALREALAFYADPESYHAIGFLADRPCGAFADDFSEDHGDEYYNRPMPGKAAREALWAHLRPHIGDKG